MKRFFTLLSLIFLGTQLSFSQTYFSDDFDSGQGNWTYIDHNNDGYNWSLMAGTNLSLPSAAGQVLVSRSWSNNVPITPNNLAVSPAIDLTGASGNVFLEYTFYTNQGFPQDKYSVYVSTSNTATDILATTPIHTETGTALTAVGTIRMLDLSSYMGQTIYVTFRHYDCYDKDFIAIDNLSVKTISNNDVSLESANIQEYILANQNTSLELELKNVGANEISSVTVNWNDGTDHVATIPVTIAAGETATVNHPTALNYSTATSYTIDVIITEVNGNTDPDMSNNSQSTSLRVISQDGGTKALIEEGTGTWCGWCPRGAVAMEYMYGNHSDKFVGIAVHNGDPMTNTEYDNAVSFTGFPGMHMDRTYKDVGVSLELMESYVLWRSAIPNPVSIDIDTNVSGNQLTVDASATFYSNYTNANLRLAAIVVEDGVTGTTAGYAQVNYYSGGGSGTMGGYENLPATVPANMMVYDHVGRALLGGYDGVAGSVPATLTDGETVNYTFSYTIPATYDIDQISVVVVVLDADTGYVVNSNMAYAGTLSVNDLEVNAGFSVYPNPATDIVNLQINQDGKFAVKIYDITGKEVFVKTPEFLTSNSALSLNVSSLSQGVYIISIEGEHQSFSKKLIIQ